VATLTVYENGCSAGRGNGAPTGGLRGIVDGWSPSAARRHKQWLWSVKTEELDGNGVAVTLTLRDVPETHTEWVALVDRLYRVFRDAEKAGMLLRWCHVVEWQWGGQGRGAPHLHLAIYAPAGSPISDIMSPNRSRPPLRDGQDSSSMGEDRGPRDCQSR
jgi:hypothetical protein